MKEENKMNMELEIKYETKSHNGIILAKAELLAEGVERNSYMDFDGKLNERGARFRVREYNHETTVTLKEKGNFVSGIKSRPETNIVMKCSFLDALVFYQSLGGEEIGYYEKSNRKIYRLEDCIVCLDKINNGNARYFVEIEGPTIPVIQDKAAIIGMGNPKLDAKIVKASYYSMFARKRKQDL